ncbi:MAG TPA: NAD-dependent epimerase/dehydratase family protein [Anaerolineales bacterium]|nr:NAD-dependent epimerase/dehydratase family protein [Anaerolineales bacterium]
MNFESIYKNQKVLITGGLGFIGSNLARKLLGLGADVTLYDNADPESGANPFNLDGIRQQVKVVEADILDEGKLREAVKGQRYLFNLAGEMSHIGSMQDPFKDLNVNAVGQLKLLEVCRTTNPAISIVFAGTRQVYGRPNYLPVDEKHLLTPLDNNGVSKRAGEMYHIVYNRVHGMATCVLRMTNTYGPRMRIRDARLTFIGWWFRQLLEGKPIQIFGDGSQIRDFNHVDDVADAMLRVVSQPVTHGKIYNLGGEPINLLNLARLMIEIHGSGTYEIVPFPAGRKRIDIGDYYGNYDLIKNETGWQPCVKLLDGIKNMLEYYYQHKEHYL